MSVELKEKQDGSIPVSEMRDGQIGVIVNWDVERHKGKVVQRSEKNLFRLGHEDRWSDFFKNKLCIDTFRVKIIKNGTELIIKDNE